MAFQDTCYSVIIDAILTDAGRRKMAAGKFEVTKFALGDDEIDYSLQASGSLIEQLHTEPTATTDPVVTLTGSALYEAFGTPMANIRYGLKSYPQQDILYMPVLKLNTKKKIDIAVQPGGGWAGSTSPTGSIIYLSVNSETSDKITVILSGAFDFLEASVTDSKKIVIESGLDTLPDIPSAEAQPIDYNPNNYGLVNLAARDFFLCRYGLLDYNFFVSTDARFINRVVGTRGCDGIFKNYANGTLEVNFISSYDCVPTTLNNPFDNYQTYMVEGVDNLIIDHHPVVHTSSVLVSALTGPKGTATALNLSIHNDLKVSSAGTRNYRYTNYGEINQKIFDTTHKFDYIDTTLYIVGAATDAELQVPIRIIRYVGK